MYRKCDHRKNIWKIRDCLTVRTATRKIERPSLIPTRPDRYLSLTFRIRWQGERSARENPNRARYITLYARCSQNVRKTDAAEPSPDTGLRLQLQHRRGLLQADDGSPGPQVLRHVAGRADRQARDRVFRRSQEPVRLVRGRVDFRRVQAFVADKIAAQRFRLEAVVARRRIRTRGKKYDRRDETIHGAPRANDGYDDFYVSFCRVLRKLVRTFCKTCRTSPVPWGTSYAIWISVKIENREWGGKRRG